MPSILLANTSTTCEHQAHRAAIEVDRPAPAAGRSPHADLDPLSDPGAGSATSAPPSVGRVVHDDRGEPLEPSVRRSFDQLFGHDFSQVRVHSGAAAQQSARDVDARAYTVGTNIVFGAGQYAPGTPTGRRVLAHELAHVIQQRRGNDYESELLQRFSVSDALETGARVTLGPLAGALVRLEKQFIDDLVASVQESPQHVMEFFENEVWEQIKANWLRIVIVTAGLVVAEQVIAGLAAVPEPTMLTKVVAAILQIVVLAILGYFAAVEVVGAYQEGRRWLEAVRRANGEPAAISEGSRAFVRMVWHIVMAVMAVAGVRARVRGGVLPATGGARPGGGTPGGGVPADNVVPISRHPAYSPRFQPRPEPMPAQPGPSAFGPGGTARQLAPAEVPVSTPAPAAVPATSAPALPAPATAAAPGAGPGVQVGPAVAAGLSAGTQPGPRPPFVLRLPLEKQPHLGTYRRWLGVLQSDPNYARGRPAQLDKWHQAHRLGDSHGIPREVYERGHALGLTGEQGERRIRVPNWTWTRSIAMEVDHMVELQLTPLAMRDAFDDVDNYELLDATSNVASRNRLVGSIARERAIQVAWDPSAANRILRFDRVELDGGRPGERWTSEAIRQGEQLDAYERIRD